MTNYYNKYQKYKLKYLNLKEGSLNVDHNNNHLRTTIEIKFDFKTDIFDYYSQKYIDLKKFYQKASSLKKYSDLDLEYSKTVKFYYFYILKITLKYNNKDVSNISIVDGKVENIIKDKNNIYIQFYLLKPTTNLVLEINNSIEIKGVGVYEMTYKSGDSYVLGATKPLKHIYQIVQQQYFNRVNFPKNLSNIIFNELVSNKLDYTQFLMDKGLIPSSTTKIIKSKIDSELTKQNSQEHLENGYVIKYPYSSISGCVFLPSKKKMNTGQCYTDLGYIAQKFNKTLKDYEFKCHVVDGKIIYIMIRKSLETYECVAGDLISDNSNINEILHKYGDEIKRLCKTTFNEMNRLYGIKLKRLQYEMNMLYSIIRKMLPPTIHEEFLHKFYINRFNSKLDHLYKNNALESFMKEFLYPFRHKQYYASFQGMFTSLLVNKKIQRLQKLKGSVDDHKVKNDIDELIKVYKLTDYEFATKYLSDEDKSIKIYESYMRIDIALPDNDLFKTCYINEVEPFASGRGTISKDTSSGCIQLFGEQSGTTVILNKIMENKINNDDIEFVEVEYSVR